ncbi:MAG: 16S rRNA (guanine(527)-N(7))-methyltransferase RsmG [Chloroflexi bacterium]|nr:16S rRNA (guanine(527)-N(7))-methyltransferase RsmG [Chloroflexota bacterium]
MSGPPAATLPAVRAAVGAVGASVDGAQIAALDRYRTLLLDWNQRVNLTGVREPAAFELLHLVDAVGFLRAVDQAALVTARLVDVGSGGGLPGLPLAILAPGLRVTLVEATGKKVAFLRAAVAALDLAGVEARHGRAEDLAHQPDLREQFDLATARAVAPLPALVELCLPFLRPGGRLLAAKTTGVEAEIAAADRALRRLGGDLVGVVPLDLPGLDDRQIVVIRKVGPTPAAYPRRAGLPAHQPLR